MHLVCVCVCNAVVDGCSTLIHEAVLPLPIVNWPGKYPNFKLPKPHKLLKPSPNQDQLYTMVGKRELCERHYHLMFHNTLQADSQASTENKGHDGTDFMSGDFLWVRLELLNGFPCAHGPPLLTIVLVHHNKLLKERL